MLRPQLRFELNGEVYSPAHSLNVLEAIDYPLAKQVIPGMQNHLTPNERPFVRGCAAFCTSDYTGRGCSIITIDYNRRTSRRA